MENNNSRVGIITFHCSNNFGAVLQAYAIKTWLRNKGVKADIVRYEPFFMTGRHWWIPYAPIEGRGDRLNWKKETWKANLRMGTDFYRQKANYKRFKKKYLFNKGQKKLLITKQMKGLPYTCYIVGSDQIWNPDITYGLRKVYFGDFENRKKKRVVAFAASLGGRILNEKYGDEFKELISYVDAISVREEEAVAYVRNFSKKEVISVLDPVFLLEKEFWQRVEKKPKSKRYILVYTTEWNKELQSYALRLAKEKGLTAVMLRTGKYGVDEGFEVDYTAGPAEFLGYIHYADYVVTNSFHAIAFCVIFQKQFLAFLHRSRGIRIKNILHIHGLEERICNNSKKNEQIDELIDWAKVKSITTERIKISERFLLENVCF